MTALKKGNLLGVLESRKPAPAPVAETKDLKRIKVIFTIPPTAKKQFDFMAVEHGRTKQALFCEALNDFFQKYGKPPIA